MVLEQPRSLVSRELPLPQSASTTVCCAIEACGLCGTDHEQYTGSHPGRLPVRAGPRSRGRDRAARPTAPPTGGRSTSATELRSRCSCRVERATNASPAATDDVHPPRHRRHVRLHRRGQGAGALGWLRDASVPRARRDVAAGSRRARSRDRDVVQPARRRHPVGRDAARDTTEATSSPCSVPACAGCRRAPRRRMPVPSSCS